jgi:hypothetical protein
MEDERHVLVRAPPHKVLAVLHPQKRLLLDPQEGDRIHLIVLG